MKIARKQLWYSIVIGFGAIANPVHGQIVPDGTTINTSVLGNCQSSCGIDGGTVAGQNLFHSFQEFNIPPAARVYFNDPGMVNIFSRVTGNNPSEIFGTLGVLGGNANLFLLNPNGIIFGEGATLDLNGSFFATTADEIQFGDRSFAATPNPSENNSLLTVNPSALFFNQLEQGSIIVEGADLNATPGQNITLLGKGEVNPGIEIDNSNINVSDGSIILGAVAGRAEVKIGEDLQLEFGEDTVKGDISLTAASSVVASHSDRVVATKIDIEAGNLLIKENSEISSLTNSSQAGAEIEIDASESVQIIGEDTDVFQQFLVGNLTPGGSVDFTGSRLQAIALGAGDAGNITITTPNLTLDNGAGIISTNRDRGASGNIDLNISETLKIKASGIITGSITFSQGGVGAIDIDTNQLVVEKGGVISSSTLGNGNAGNLTIDAADSIQIKETLPDSIIPTGVFTNTIFGNGNGGNLAIDTPKLILQNGGQLSSSSGAITRMGLIPVGGEGGNININAQSIEVGGASDDGVFYSSILSDTRTSNPGGNLTIDTGNLFLNQEGFISASSIGTGMGGDITINARDSVELEGVGVDSVQELFISGLAEQLDIADVRQGLIAFTLFEGDGGDILIDTSNLIVESGAILATATLGNGNAGDLNLTASDRMNIIGSTIAVPTFGSGNAGKIDINTKSLSLTQGGAIASASVGSGNAGDLSINATESVEISNPVPGLLFSGSISTGSYKGLGSPGNLAIDTRRLTIKDGANIQANNTLITFSGITDNISSLLLENISSSPSELTINASESIEIAGSSSQSNPFSPTSGSHISSTTSTLAPASNIKITTPNLAILDRGEISVNSLGDGAAGRLEIMADNVTLENEGNLNGTTTSGRGGNIVLQVDDILRLENGSAIDTNAIARGNGGNIDITADFVIASENSSISANAAMGDGGNVDIIAKELFISPDSQITADSILGIDGTVKIDTTTDIDNNYTELPQKIILTENTIIQSCGNGNGRQDIFSYTGRGGLPSNPLTESRVDDIVIADLEIPSNSTIESFGDTEASNTMSDDPQLSVVEANHWTINAEGKVELVVSNSNKAKPTRAKPLCPFLSYR